MAYVSDYTLRFVDDFEVAAVKGQDAINELVWARLKAPSAAVDIYHCMKADGLVGSSEAVKFAVLSSPFLHEELVLAICRMRYIRYRRDFDLSSYCSD